MIIYIGVIGVGWEFVAMPGFLFLTPTFNRRRKSDVIKLSRSSPSSRSHSPEPNDNFLLLNPGNSFCIPSVPADVHHPVLPDGQPFPPVAETDAALAGARNDRTQNPDTNIADQKLMPSADNILSDVNSNEEDDLCGDHEHFSIPVVDEILNIPVDSVFTYCFTDSAVFRDFVAARKTFDVLLSPWPEEPDANGTKIRNITYTLSLNYSIGPKVSPSTERQIMYPESKHGRKYLIDAECINAGIPYGENFYVINRYCISRISSTRCRFRVTSQIKYRKNVWTLVKNFIEKNATAGIKESFGVLADLLRQESCRPLAQVPSVQPCNLSRKKVLRRRRSCVRPVARGITTDTQLSSSARLEVSVSQSISNAILTRIRDELHIRINFDGLVRIVAFVLLVLVFFNGILFYKLWNFESSAATLIHSRLSFYDMSVLNETPKTSQEWLHLLDRQHMLHEAEAKQWKDILSTLIELLDQMTRTLSELRSNLDKRPGFA